VISNGKPRVGLLDVGGYSALDAQRTLQGQGFAVTVVRKFDNSAKDNVIDQQPKAGSQVPQASRITLVVSNGAEPLLVPNFVGMSNEKAQAVAARLEIRLDTTQQAAIAGVPAGTIASQNPAAGGQIQKGASVSAVVSTGVQTGPLPAAAGVTTITVPGVVGKPYQDAIDAILAAGFRAAVQFQILSANNGTVVAEDPPAATQLAQGSAVTISLSVPGEVPDTEGMAVDKARATLSAAGYGVAQARYTTAAGAGGRVVGTEPAVGTTLSPGSAVVLIVNGAPPQ